MESTAVRSLASRLLSMIAGGALVALLILAAQAWAQESPAAAPAPQGSVIDVSTAIQNIITYQGILLDPQGYPKASGTYQMTFRLYRDNTTVVWQETQNIVVADGFFSARLGSVTGLGPDLFVGSQLFIGVQVAGDAEMSPRQHFTYVPYAMAAQRLLQFRAYGVVDSDGDRVNGGPNFTSSLENVGGIQSFVIDIKENYNLNDYSTVVTPVLNSTCPFAIIPTTGSSDGKLIVDLFNTAGQRVYCKFHFTVLDLP